MRDEFLDRHRTAHPSAAATGTYLSDAGALGSYNHHLNEWRHIDAMVTARRMGQ